MLRYRAQLYERCSLGAIPTSGMSSQCPDTGIQLLCNLIKNVCFSVRQLPLAHQLSYKQNFWIPVSSTGMTPFAVQFIAFLIIVRTGHRKAESTARRKDSNRGMFFLALFFIANQ
ncbi:hypothetical protein [Wolbachia pipientis]|uniref:hypothetical protein n=1 Tax=Wolbachia pipientis TaxID=955 RepID=UPI001C7147A3|nr:hypothetical protein [Wolbachia pipientis]